MQQLNLLIMSKQKKMNINPLLAHKNSLGEGPVWDPETNRLYWVDIKEGEVHWSTWGSINHSSFTFDEPVSAVALTTQTDVIVCARPSGLYFFDLNSQNSRKIHELEPTKPGNRPNDGAVDSNGRFWIGTMEDAETAACGSLFSAHNQVLTHHLGNLGISNGIGWNKASTTMYLTDSMQRTIWQFDFDETDGVLSNQQPFAIVAADAGFPDGLCVDDEDNIWSAHWDGYRITQYASNGDILNVYPVPVPRPTACTFAGPELDQLVITSASYGLTAKEIHEHPLSGQTLLMPTQTHGKPANRVPYA